MIIHFFKKKKYFSDKFCYVTALMKQNVICL